MNRYANLLPMPPIRARVRNGRLIVDEATDLPEGTVLDLVVDDGGDELDDAERAALDSAIAKAWAQVQAGKGRAGEEVLDELSKP